MPALRTVAEFVDLLARCDWLGPAFVELYLGDRTRAANAGPESFAAVLVRDGLLTVYQARHLLAGTPENLILARKYKVLDILGVGGMGQVYLCEHMSLQRRVAVKALPLGKASNPVAVERFHREARAVAALDHPNVVRCFDLDRDGSRLFLVMEYLDGASLEAIVRHRGPLSWPRAASCIAQAARGLQHAHELGWVHRDVKPANILLDRNGTVKLLDLGLARLARDAADNLTMQHNGRAILGTVDYIAPEQALSSQAADVRADIYSLGCSFYFLLAGQPPFPDGSIADKLLWHQSRQPQPLRELRPEAPRELEVIVARMMMKEPERRYQRPADVVAALTPWTAVTLQAPPSGDFPPVGPVGELPDLAGSRGLPSTDWLRPSPLDSHGGLRDSSNSLDRAAVMTRILYPSPTPTPPSAPTPSLHRSGRPVLGNPTQRLTRRSLGPPSLTPLSPARPLALLPPVPPRPSPAPEPAPWPPVVSPPRRRSRGVLRFVLIALVFAGLGYAGWFGWKVVRAQLAHAKAQPTVMRHYLP